MKSWRLIQAYRNKTVITSSSSDLEIISEQAVCFAVKIRT